MAEDTVSSFNLLDSLCFLRYIGRDKDRKEDFRTDLYNFLLENDVKYIRRQSIKYWLDKGHTPSRAQAVTFLRDYFHRKISVKSIALPNQQGVYEKASLFFHVNTDKTPPVPSERSKSVARPLNSKTIVDLRLLLGLYPMATYMLNWLEHIVCYICN